MWNDAEQNSQTSPEFNKVFSIAIEEWQKSVKKILESAPLKNHHENLDDMAWQFIGLTFRIRRAGKVSFSFIYLSIYDSISNSFN